MKKIVVPILFAVLLVNASAYTKGLELDAPTCLRYIGGDYEQQQSNQPVNDHYITTYILYYGYASIDNSAGYYTHELYADIDSYLAGVQFASYSSGVGSSFTFYVVPFELGLGSGGGGGTNVSHSLSAAEVEAVMRKVLADINLGTGTGGGGGSGGGFPETCLNSI